MPHRLVLLVNWTIENYWAIFWAVIAGFLNYFIELREAVYVMLFAFSLDLIFGISASVWIDKDRFHMKKFFIAVARLVISILLIILLFVMGKIMGIGKDLYNLGSWIISGAFGYSAAINGYKLTGGRVFLLVKDLINKKIKDNTGISIDKLNGEMYEKD